MSKKKRLDHIVAERMPHLSKRQVQSLIMQGKVCSNGKILDKSGALVAPDIELEIELLQEKYVSRAGFKLEHALNQFGINVKDMVVLDAGISTGGFTDCLLQHGACRVYGVDVGYGQVHEKLRNDERVVLVEKTNLRTLENLPELVDLVTLDLSFISVLKVLPTVIRLAKSDAIMIVLIKPQFEAKKEEVSRGGVIKDEKLREKIVERVRVGIEAAGWEVLDVIESPIKGAKSQNVEYLAWCKRKVNER